MRDATNDQKTIRTSRNAARFITQQYSFRKTTVSFLTGLITEQSAFADGRTWYQQLSQDINAHTSYDIKLDDKTIGIYKNLTGLFFLYIDWLKYSHSNVPSLFFTNSVRPIFLLAAKHFPLLQKKEILLFVNTILFLSINAMSEEIKTESVVRWIALYAMIQSSQYAAEKIIDHFFEKSKFAQILLKAIALFIICVWVFPALWITVARYFFAPTSDCATALKTLGLNTDASHNDILQAERALLRTYHPDKSSGNTELAKKILEAKTIALACR